MQTKNWHKKAIERQVLESIRIEEGSIIPSEELSITNYNRRASAPGGVIGSAPPLNEDSPAILPMEDVPLNEDPQ